MEKHTTPHFYARLSRWLIITVVAAILPLAIASTAAAAAKAQTAALDTPVSDTIMQTLRQAATNSLDTTVLPQHNSLQKILGSPVQADGQPTVLYMGADYCPYCAAMRWPLIVALLRFGTFSGVKYMRSSHDDVYADTATFSFHGASYSSNVIRFASVEFQDRKGKRLEQPNKRQIDIFKKFDMPPYTSAAGGIPFLYLDGQYMQSGSPFNPAVLKDQNWQAVATALSQPDAPLRQAIIGTANIYTAAICKLTNGQPDNVCNAKAVTAAAQAMASSE